MYESDVNRPDDDEDNCQSDQVYYTDPARSDFWEPAGDSTHLVTL